MKRIISLGLAALILLGTLTGVLMSAVYAEEENSEISTEEIDKAQEQLDKMLALLEQLVESGKPISAGGGLSLIHI